MPSYLADFEAEFVRLGDQAFVRAYPSPVFVVTGIAGALGDNASKSGTMVATSMDAMMQASALAGRVFPAVKGKGAGPGPVSIGRTADNDLAIPEYTISTHHCLLAMVDGEYRLTDLGATNGTRVDDVPLVPRKPCRLKGGETVVMGRFSMLFHLARGFAEYLAHRTRPSTSSAAASAPKKTT